MVEKTGDTVYTENEILDWYLSMDIGSEPVTTTTPVTTDITTTETTVVTTQTTAISTTSAAETTPVTTTVTIPEIKGDANGDGKLAQSSISGEKITAEDYPSMDFNQDGKITAKDAADIARYLAEQSIT